MHKFDEWWENTDIGKFYKWFFLFLALLIGLFFGWLNPVEGPLDYLYDEYSSQPAHKRPTGSAPPPQKVQLIINLEDLSLEDFEELQRLFYEGK